MIFDIMPRLGARRPSATKEFVATTLSNCFADSSLEVVLRDRPEYLAHMSRVAFMVVTRHFFAHGAAGKESRWETLNDVTSTAGIQFKELVSNSRGQMCLEQ